MTQGRDYVDISTILTRNRIETLVSRIERIG